MARSVERSRNNCALQGAIQTAQAIDGVVPIVHSTAGCGVQQLLGGNWGGGCSGAGYTGGHALPSSNVAEKHVIFGGGSRLREQIKNTVKVVKGELYLVLSGCTTELVGDDIPAMTKEAREQGFPVLYANTPGFLGSAYRGYQIVLKALIEQLPLLGAGPGSKGGRLVNVLGVVPNQDVHWEGNLLELKRVAAAAGVEANTLLGQGSGVEGLRKIPQAELNLVLSPWGMEAAHLLAQKYGTPWLYFPSLPVGAESTAKLLDALSTRLKLDQQRIDELKRLDAEEEVHYLEKIADAYFEFGFQKEFALVGDAAFASGLATFLAGTMGLLPRVAVISDNPPEPVRGEIAERLKGLVPGGATQVFFTEDSGEIGELIRSANPELVLGSALERDVAAGLGVPFLEISFPLFDRVVLRKGYLGSSGGVAFLEELSRVLM